MTDPFPVPPLGPGATKMRRRRLLGAALPRPLRERHLQATNPLPQMHMVRLCGECGRSFNLTDPNQADEWHYGHDCEQP